MQEHSIFVVAYDFSSHADAALYAAADLARRIGAEIRLVHVVQHPTALGAAPIYGDPVPLEATPVLRERAMESLQKIVDGLDLPDLETSAHVVEGISVDRALCEFCEKAGADLLIMGTHGRTGMAHVFLGSVAERTLRRAPCPVMTLRSAEEGETAE